VGKSCNELKKIKKFECFHYYREVRHQETWAPKQNPPRPLRGAKFHVTHARDLIKWWRVKLIRK